MHRYYCIKYNYFYLLLRYVQLHPLLSGLLVFPFNTKWFIVMHAKGTFEQACAVWCGEELEVHLLLAWLPFALHWRRRRRLPIFDRSALSKSWQWRSVQLSRSVSVGWENRSSFDLCDLLHLQNDDDYDMRSSSNVRVYKRTHIMYTRLGYGVHHVVAGWWRRWANWVRINLTSKTSLL